MNPASKEANPSAAYRRIEESLRSRIRQGHWPAGTMLPSRRELAAEYGVSRITMERAVTHLLADGTLRADVGRGTFVTDTAPTESAAEPAARHDLDLRTPKHAGLERLTDQGRAVVAAYDRPYLSHRATAAVGLVGISQSPSGDLLYSNRFSVMPILQSLERVLAKTGSTTIFFERFRLDQTVVPIEEAISSLLEDQIDGLVVIDLFNDPEVVAVVTALSPVLPIPLVYVSAGAVVHQCLHVYHENQSGGFIAAQHLLRQGVDRLLFFVPYSAEWADFRYAGAQAAVQHAGLPAETLLHSSPEPSIPVEDQETQSYQAARSALRNGLIDTSGNGPIGHYPGVIAANDLIAYGFIRAAAEVGLKPGVDYAILGFDDAPPSRAMRLTSLRRPLEAMGEEAALLLQRALSDHILDMEVRLRMHLVPRASTRVRTLSLQQSG